MTDVIVFAGAFAAFYGVLAIARTWFAPYPAAAEISQAPSALPLYAAFSLLRIAVAYGLSLGFALGYGYITAYSPRAERWLLPLLDVLQSIPVLSFLPGVVLAMVALFPGSRLGVELATILLIFSGQVWNIAFSFYSSLKSIPRDLLEAARISRFGKWQRFTQLELPFAAVGLVWNSMMSVAGGWFFLMACEMFVVGDKDFRLPGLGSYLQTAASAGNVTEILWGLTAMIGLIVLLDLLVWRPVIAWADKFKFEQIESSAPPQSKVLTLFYRSSVLSLVRKKVLMPSMESLQISFARKSAKSSPHRPSRWRTSGVSALSVVLFAGITYGAVRAGHMLFGLSAADLKHLAHGAGITFLRVNVAILISAAWTIPAGVAIGLSPRLARVAYPLAEIGASVPATALFPVLLLILIRAGGGMQTASLALMVLGTQWYILFNVIAGAIAIPADLKEAAKVFRFGRIARWQRLILPAIFPYLVTGLVTASGGAWNASIIAEYFDFKGRILSIQGLGATISRATAAGDFPLLLAATMLMAGIVVVINRTIWQRLYRLATTRYRLEG